MCGIAGFIRKQSDDSTAVLKKMASAIVHRGPDAEGYFETKIYGQQSCDVGLAHRRLAIIDLDAGHQPMKNEENYLWVVFNGEIYNYFDLQKTLTAKGHHFQTNSDTETIIHAYEEFRERCVEHLEGMFAFAIWDTKQERMFLARDRFGKKPLFFCKTQDSFHFASEIKSLLACPEIQPQINNSALFHYFSYRYVPGPDTLFAGIKKLPPASVAVWEKGVLQQHCYYTPPDKFARCFSISSPENPVASFLALFNKAVKMRMISDVPFGAFLSGGIDSSAVVALMSKHSAQPVKTFSIGFKEKKYSELSYAEEVARKFNTDHHTLLINHEHIITAFEELIWFRDAPIAEASDIPIFFLAKEARKKVKMVLTGEGSDEILGGYPKHIFEKYANLYQMVPSILRQCLIAPFIQALPYEFRRTKIAATCLDLKREEERFPRWFGALCPDEQHRLLTLPPSALSEQQQFPFKTDKNNTLLRKILYFDQTSWLPDNLLERGDRMTMAASLEARMPFMDHHLVEFVSSLPDTWRIKGHQTKRILREAMKQILPEKILNRSKVGFRVPVNLWFQGPMREYVYDHLTGTGSISKIYYNQTELHRILHEHVSGKSNHEKQIWMMLGLELWHRKYKMTP